MTAKRAERGWRRGAVGLVAILALVLHLVALASMLPRAWSAALTVSHHLALIGPHDHAVCEAAAPDRDGGHPHRGKAHDDCPVCQAGPIVAKLPAPLVVGPAPAIEPPTAIRPAEPPHVASPALGPRSARGPPVPG